MAYIELHACSAFSFLDGCLLPEKLAEEAARLDYPALALVDLDGFYGAPRFYKACNKVGIRPLVGAEITLHCESQGHLCRLPVLVETRQGYQNLCHLITRMKLRSKKGEGSIQLSELEEFSGGLVGLTGGVSGPLRVVGEITGAWTARKYLERLKDIFGPQNLFVELQRHFDRPQEEWNQLWVELAQRIHLPLLASNGVRYAKTSGRPLLDVLTCIHHKTSLDQAGQLLTRNAECYLKTAGSMNRLFADLSEAVSNTVELSQRLQFTLQDLGYCFPEYPVPPGENVNTYLCKLTEAGAQKRYHPYHRRARRQVTRELDLIKKLNLAGYFLIVWDLVRFCREQDILVQGRGSAANRAVCYSLGITAVDPVGMDLLFERFLSEERREWPDIDLDLPSGERRECVIQYLYQHYGELGAAMTANVITYRERSAVREVGKALGFPSQSLDRLSRLLHHWGPASEKEEFVAQRFQEAS